MNRTGRQAFQQALGIDDYIRRQNLCFERICWVFQELSPWFKPRNELLEFLVSSYWKVRGVDPYDILIYGAPPFHTHLYREVYLSLSLSLSLSAHKKTQKFNSQVFISVLFLSN